MCYIPPIFSLTLSVLCDFGAFLATLVPLRGGPRPRSDLSSQEHLAFPIGRFAISGAPALSDFGKLPEST